MMMWGKTFSSNRQFLSLEKLGEKRAAKEEEIAGLFL